MVDQSTWFLSDRSSTSPDQEFLCTFERYRRVWLAYVVFGWRREIAVFCLSTNTIIRSSSFQIIHTFAFAFI
jgi:hypothetical protein